MIYTFTYLSFTTFIILYHQLIYYAVTSLAPVIIVLLAGGQEAGPPGGVDGLCRAAATLSTASFLLGLIWEA